MVNVVQANMDIFSSICMLTVCCNTSFFSWGNPCRRLRNGNGLAKLKVDIENLNNSLNKLSGHLSIIADDKFNAIQVLVWLNTIRECPYKVNLVKWELSYWNNVAKKKDTSKVQALSERLMELKEQWEFAKKSVTDCIGKSSKDLYLRLHGLDDLEGLKQLHQELQQLTEDSQLQYTYLQQLEGKLDAANKLYRNRSRGKDQSEAFLGTELQKDVDRHMKNFNRLSKLTLVRDNINRIYLMVVVQNNHINELEYSIKYINSLDALKAKLRNDKTTLQQVRLLRRLSDFQVEQLDNFGAEYRDVNAMEIIKECLKEKTKMEYKKIATWIQEDVQIDDIASGFKSQMN